MAPVSPFRDELPQRYLIVRPVLLPRCKVSDRPHLIFALEAEDALLSLLQDRTSVPPKGVRPSTSHLRATRRWKVYPPFFLV